MKINIESEGFPLTPSIKTYVEKKISPLGRLVKRFEESGELIAFVEVGRVTRHHKHGDVFRAAVTIETPQKNFFAENNNVDLHIAIDVVKNKIKDDIVKYKEKIVAEEKRKIRTRKDNL